MADKPIDSSEVIEADVFQNAIDSANKFLEVSREIEQQLRDNLKASRDFFNSSRPNNARELDEQAEAARKAAQEMSDLHKVEQERLKAEKLAAQLEREKQRLIQDTIRTENAAENQAERTRKAQERAAQQLRNQNSEYRQSVARLRELKEQLKELEIRGRGAGIVARGLREEFNQLNEQVRNAEQSVGEFQRNVGNYPDALAGIGNAVVAAFSVDGIVTFGQKILETRAQFQKFEAVLTNTLGSESEAADVLQRIQVIAAKTPFSVAQLTESYVKLANQGFKPTNEELIKLGDLAASQGKDFDQLTEAIIDAQTGEFERLKEFGIRASKEGDKVKFTFKGVETQTKFTNDAIRDYIIGLGDLKGVSGGMAAISETLEGKISNLGDAFDTFFNNLGKNSQGVMSFVLGQLADMVNKGNEIEDTYIRINDQLLKAGREQSFFDNIAGGNKTLFVFQNLIDNILRKESTNDGIFGTLLGRSNNILKVTQLSQQLSLLEKLYKEGKLSLDDYSQAQILLGNAIQNLRNKINESNEAKAEDNELTKEQIKAAKELAKANQDLENQLIKLRIDNTQLDQRREEDAARNEARLAKQKLAESKGNAETKRAIEVNIEEKLRQDLLKIRDKYAEMSRKRDEEERRTAHEKAIKDEEDFQKRLAIVDPNDHGQIKRNNEELARRKAEREQLVKDAAQTSSQVIDIVQREVAETARLRDEGYAKDIKDKEDAIDIQRRLAEQGKANTLAFEEEQKRQLEVQREEEKQKEVKRQKLLAFFKLFSSYAEKDPNTALQNAARDTILAEAIAGSFFTGTERVEDDLSAFKKHDGRDGYHIAVDGSERILTGQQNEMVGNLSNEELAKVAHDYRLGILRGAEYTVLPPKNFADRIQDNALLYRVETMTEEIRDLKEIMKNKPVHQVDVKGLIESITTTIEGGFAKRTTNKHRKPRI